MSCFPHGYFFFVIIVLFNKEALCFSAFRYGKLSNLVVASRSNALENTSNFVVVTSKL